MFKEQKLWSNFRDYSIGLLNMHRIENMIAEGMADVIAINREGAVFWLELKALDKWPARATTCPLKGKFEKGQLPFLRQWRSWKGHSFVLLRVGLDYFLLDPRLDLDKLTKDGLVELAAFVKGRAEVREYLEDLE